MLDYATQSLLVLMLLPGLAIIGIALNLFIRARGGRTFSLKINAFGVNIHLESNTARPRKGDQDEATL